MCAYRSILPVKVEEVKIRKILELIGGRLTSDP